MTSIFKRLNGSAMLWNGGFYSERQLYCAALDNAEKNLFVETRNGMVLLLADGKLSTPKGAWISIRFDSGREPAIGRLGRPVLPEGEDPCSQD
jgi:hypothetical protein